MITLTSQLHNMLFEVMMFIIWHLHQKIKRKMDMKMKTGPVSHLLLLALLAHRHPSSVLWVLRPARTTRSVSSTNTSVMEKQTARMGQMRRSAHQNVKRVSGVCFRLYMGRNVLPSCGQHYSSSNASESKCLSSIKKII